MAIAFVYGTLMAEEVLARVISGVKTLENSSVHYEDAVLEGYRRFKLKERDYPGIMETGPENSVNGRVVFNLSESDVAKLDVFEGDEYKRVLVNVKTTDGKIITANTYLWTDKSLVLSDEPDWCLNVFKQRDMHKWVANELVETAGLGGRFWNGTTSVAADRMD